MHNEWMISGKQQQIIVLFWRQKEVQGILLASSLCFFQIHDRDKCQIYISRTHVPVGNLFSSSVARKDTTYREPSCRKHRFVYFLDSVKLKESLELNFSLFINKCCPMDQYLRKPITVVFYMYSTSGLFSIWTTFSLPPPIPTMNLCEESTSTDLDICFEF